MHKAAMPNYALAHRLALLDWQHELHFSMARPHLRLHDAPQYLFGKDTVAVHVVFTWIS